MTISDHAKDPKAAIRFALALGATGGFLACFDFLETWNDGDWQDLEAAYPEFFTEGTP